MAIKLPVRDDLMESSHKESVIYKDCIFFNGQLKIKKVPYVKLDAPTINGEEYAKELITSLTIGVIGEVFREENLKELSMDYYELAQLPEIQKRVNEYLNIE